MAKYKTYKIEEAKTEKFPDMVTISKKIKGKPFMKKFINEDKAKAWIDGQSNQKLIDNGSKKVKSQLSSIGIIPKNELAW